MGTVFLLPLLCCDLADGAGDAVQGFGADGDPDGHLVLGPVVAGLELEGLIQAPLERLGKLGEPQRELRQRLEQPGVPAAGFCRLIGEPGEFGALRTVLGDQLGKPVLDGLAVFAAGVGVTGDWLGFELGD